MGRTIHYSLNLPRDATVEDKCKVYDLNEKFCSAIDWTCESPDMVPFNYYPNWDSFSDAKKGWKAVDGLLKHLEQIMHPVEAIIEASKHHSDIVRVEPAGQYVRGKYPAKNALTARGFKRWRCSPARFRGVKDRFANYDKDIVVARVALDTRRGPSHMLLAIGRNAAKEFGYMHRKDPGIFIFEFPEGEEWSWARATFLVEEPWLIQLAQEAGHCWNSKTWSTRLDPKVLVYGFTKVAGNELNALFIYMMLLEASTMFPEGTVYVYDEGKFCPFPIRIKNAVVSFDRRAITLMKEREEEHRKYREAVKSGTVFKRVNPYKYRSHPKFRTMVFDFDEKKPVVNTEAVLHTMEKQLQSTGALKTQPVSEDAGIMDVLFKPDDRTWDWLGYGQNFDNSFGDEQGFDLNLLVKKFKV